MTVSDRTAKRICHPGAGGATRARGPFRHRTETASVSGAEADSVLRLP